MQSGWLFPAVAQLLLFLLVAGMAGSVDTGILKERFRRPRGIILGLCCQFLILPLAGFAAAWACDLDAVYGFALLCVTSSPGGAYSNWWCSLFNADLALSIAMTTCSTIVSVVMTPANLLLYGRLSYGTVPSLSWPRLLMSIGVCVVSIGVGLCVSTLFPERRRSFNVCGNVAGLVLITLSLAVSSRDDPIWNKDASFYVAVGFPCVLGLVLSFGVGSAMPHISGPEAVACAVETSYQNTGLALTIALATFEEEQRGRAAGVPLYYGACQIVLLPLFLLFSWRMGLTYAPKSARIDRVIREDFQPRSSSSPASSPASSPCASPPTSVPPTVIV